MLTVRYDWLGVRAGDLVLDLGCGAGRHAFEAFRRGARVVPFDRDGAELKDVRGLLEAMEEAGEVEPPLAAGEGAPMAAPVNGDATALPFADGRFDRVIAAEVLEHVGDDAAAVGELARVLRPGGTMAVTVPSWLPERVCWALSEEYHAPFVEGGHLRIYTRRGLRRLLADAGLVPGRGHRAHALHSPYWWLRCAVGPADADHPLVRAYHGLLVRDIAGQQPLATLTRLADRVGNPLLGKSLVVYARKPDAAA